MLSKVLGIPEPDEDDLFEVIDAKDGGNIAHTLMEGLVDSDMTVEEFMKLSDEVFMRFMAEHPPIVPEKASAKRDEFLTMMENAYNTNPHREVVLKEENVESVHESGIHLHGYPDRVEKTEDGSYRIVDFKTGRRLKHESDDIETCLQGIIYAYILEKSAGLKVSGAEFRYIRLGETVTCKYDEEIKKALSDKLSEFKAHLEAADFPIPDNAYEENRDKDDPGPCQYCKYGMVCGK